MFLEGFFLRLHRKHNKYFEKKKAMFPYVSMLLKKSLLRVFCEKIVNPQPHPIHKKNLAKTERRKVLAALAAKK
ncbi:hypothetical protein SAMN03080598_04208 [Algoriphagus boritolerans DSM 17298 = JCM 18970]|uniref:Uncharacterized protein n=1 Tax=Algoriphagus boritolerans DSM 17298 = JCM 18970 TaxID=1120964 RepID=A0A1H6AMB2_9BACT|nr:hypothetical protein SAMN03080598_04208 [Algoriphagus boritolerans DSM 17298 = JCM 18970]